MAHEELVGQHLSATAAATGPRPLLVVKDVEKRFGGRGPRARVVRALAGVSLEVVAGTVTGLVGQSGSGKTTLGRCMCGLERPSAGEVWLGDTNLAALSPQEMRAQWQHLQMVFQNPFATLDPRMSVAAIVREPLDNFTIGAAEERAATVDRILSDTGLDPSLGRQRPGALSGGQRQRVALARALVLSPRIVIMDEPVSALDVSVQAQVLTLIRELQRQRQTTFVIILHDLAVARQVCDELLVMHRGQVVERGPTESVLQSPSDPYTAELLAAAPDVAE